MYLLFFLKTKMPILSILSHTTTKIRSFDFFNAFNKLFSCSQKLSTSSIEMEPRQPPRRALLYVPGDSERKILKVISENRIDCVAFDCEDGVAMNKKDFARKLIAKIFNQNATQLSPNVDWSVRVNSVNSGHLDDDLKILLSSSNKPKTILLPKVESSKDLDKFSEILSQNMNDEKNEKINLIFYAESCKSIMDLPDICRHAVNLSKKDDCKFKPVAIVFGSDDFLGSLGASRNVEDSTNILYARQRVVMIAKAFDLQAIDMVFINFKNEMGLLKQSIEGANLGYTGKQVIHPLQVPVVQSAFLPSKDRVEWANEVVAAYKQHQSIGVGAFVFRNQMIDNPTVNQAINILKLMELK